MASVARAEASMFSGTRWTAAGQAGKQVIQFIARLYHHAGLTPILQVLGSAVVISSGGLVNKALLQRQMSFALLARLEFLAAVINGAAAITLACLGWKIWALVIGALANAIASTLLLWLATPWQPQ